MALAPCAYSMTFRVSGSTLNAILNQRSQDMLTANNWNVVQYAVLVHMFAQVSGLVAGELVHSSPTATSTTAISPWSSGCSSASRCPRRNFMLTQNRRFLRFLRRRIFAEKLPLSRFSRKNSVAI